MSPRLEREPRLVLHPRQLTKNGDACRHIAEVVGDLPVHVSERLRITRELAELFEGQQRSAMVGPHLQDQLITVLRCRRIVEPVSANQTLEELGAEQEDLLSGRLRLMGQAVGQAVPVLSGTEQTKTSIGGLVVVRHRFQGPLVQREGQLGSAELFFVKLSDVYRQVGVIHRGVFQEREPVLHQLGQLGERPASREELGQSLVRQLVTRIHLERLPIIVDGVALPADIFSDT